jgi:hypothetical protein
MRVFDKKINIHLLQLLIIVAAGYHGHSWWCMSFFVLKSKSKRCNGGRGSEVAEGGSATSEKFVLMTAAMGEPSANEDKSTIIV